MGWKRGPKPLGWFPRRGDVCLIELDKERPALVLSDNALNRFSLDVCVVPISSIERKQFSLRPKLRNGEAGLIKDSWAKCDQVTTVEKRLAVYPPLGRLPRESMARVEDAVRTALGLGNEI